VEAARSSIHQLVAAEAIHCSIRHPHCRCFRLRDGWPHETEVRTHTREDGGSRGREEWPHETNDARAVVGEEQQPSGTAGGRCLRYLGGATASEGSRRGKDAGAEQWIRRGSKETSSSPQRGVVGFFSSRDNRRRRFLT
jgi:hypothetical protein